jgi:hypothetical protein
MAAKLAAEQAQEAAKGQRGRLVIGNHGALTIAFLPGVLSRFREEHPLVEISPWRSAGDIYVLTEPGSIFELFAIWKKQSQVEPTISKFIDVLVAELKSP